MGQPVRQDDLLLAARPSALSALRANSVEHRNARDATSADRRGPARTGSDRLGPSAAESRLAGLHTPDYLKPNLRPL